MALDQSLESSRHRMMYSFCSILARTMPSTCIGRVLQALISSMVQDAPMQADVMLRRAAHVSKGSIPLEQASQVYTWRALACSCPLRLPGAAAMRPAAWRRAATVVTTMSNHDKP